MLFIVHRVDRPGTNALRMKTRPAHLEWTKTVGARLKFAGPTLAEDGKTMNGSIWVIDADSLDAANALMTGDPYEKVGLFESKIVRHFMQTVPDPA